MQPIHETAPTSNQSSTKAIATTDPSPEKLKETASIVNPPVNPPVMASGLYILSTEDWDAERIDVPEQPLEQKPSEQWVMEIEEAASMEPRVTEEKEMIVASESEAGERLKEKAIPKMPLEAHPEQSKVSEVEARISQGQLPPPGECECVCMSVCVCMYACICVKPGTTVRIQLRSFVRKALKL